MLRAVLFDAGNTLLFLDFARMAREVGAAIGLPLTEQQLAAQAKPAALMLERADRSDRERASVYLETLFLMAGVPRSSIEAVRNRLLELHQEGHLWSGLDPGTPAALQRLKDAGLRLAVVSNSDGRVEEALEATGIRHFFEVVIDSQIVGYEKPDPRIFFEALNRLGVSPSQALYVGDIYEVDVVGARRAGMDVVLLDPLENHLHKDARTVRSVPELAKVLLDGDPSAGRTPAPLQGRT
jgi:putative hydrolase of the HAD superfamily